ncbi:MAG: hypothetical protein ACO3IB_09660, partial [Phycisphaerales bacterium]
MTSCTAPVASGFPPDRSIELRLTGFLPETAHRSSDGTIPIRWHESQSRLLADATRCREHWEKLDLLEKPDDPGLAMHSDAEPHAPRLVRTCAEWMSARADGRYAMSSLDMARESAFILAHGLLAARASARPATMSGFLDFDLAAESRRLLPGWNAAPDPEDPSTPTERWTVEGNTLWYQDDMSFDSVEPLLFADLDGDGWEDMLAFQRAGAVEGTMRWSGLRAFTRIGDGPLVEISCRLPASFPPVRAASAWLPHDRLAPNHAVALEGTCQCGGKPHPLAITVTVDQYGLLHGSLRCANMDAARDFVGALAPQKGQLQSREADGAPTLKAHFDWRHSDGKLRLSGNLGASAAMESWDFEASGLAPSTEERMHAAGWRSEIAFQLADSRLVLRRGCGTIGFRGTTDALCLESNGYLKELARLDRIEWADSKRHPEDDPATDEEMRAGLSKSVRRVGNGAEMLLLDGWNYGASTNNPCVIAIPIR